MWWILTLGVCLLRVSPIGAESAVDRIAFVGPDRQIHVIDPRGGEPLPLTRGQEPGRITRGSSSVRPVGFHAADDAPPTAFGFSMPTWAPDASSLLVHASASEDEARLRRGVFRVDLARPGVISPVHSGGSDPPIYSFWDPTGTRVGVLFGGEGELTLRVIDPVSSRADAVGTGMPHYFAWAPDGKRLLVHRGGSARGNPEAALVLHDVAGRSDTGVSPRPAGFRAPGWIHDGRRYVYVAFTEDETAHLFAGRTDGDRRDLGPVAPPIVISPSPTDAVVAVAEAAVPTASFFSGITLVDVEDGTRDPLYAGTLGAFFWSPDGSRILLAAPDFDGGPWRWVVVERESRRSRTVARFQPDSDLRALFLHFDQYALSHRLWAPDSRRFTFAAHPATPTADGAVSPKVHVVDVETGTGNVIADGSSAFWSPR